MKLSARARRLATALVGGATLLLFFGRFLSPGRTTVARDVVFFHVPLLDALARLAAHGLPEWNPAIAGGQPVLSNPNYHVFYPPAWIALVVPATYAVHLLVLAHAAIGWFGALRYARRLGDRTGAALVAALAWVGGATGLPLVHALPLLFGMAWFPWWLAALEDLIAPSGGGADPGATKRALLGAGGVFAAGILSGDPATTAIFVAAAILRVAVEPAKLGSSVRRLPLALLWGGGFAAAAVVPALARLAESERGAGLSIETAARWSLPPVRLLEIVLPHLFGDPGREAEKLFFGFGVSDRDFGYLVSLSVSILLAALGIAMALRLRDVRGRFVGALLAAGLLLALGRHDPLYRFAHAHLPGVAALRYPEKFFLLSLAGLVFGGALGLEELVALRERGERRRWRTPLVATLAIVALAAGVFGFFAFAPQAAAGFLRGHFGLPPDAETLAKGVAYLRQEAGISLALALAAAAIVLVAGRPWMSARRLLAIALVVVGVELWYFERQIVSFLPSSALLEPPPLARSIAAGGGRVFSELAVDRRFDVYLNPTGRDEEIVRQEALRADPYLGTIWGLSYVLSKDYDLSLTPAAARAATVLAGLPPRSEAALRWIGAWGGRHLLRQRPPAELLAEYRRTGEIPLHATLEENPEALPLARFVAEGIGAATPEEGLRDALASNLDFRSRDVLLRAPWSGARAFAEASIESFEQQGSRSKLRYRAAGEALLVVATTFDPDWSAEVDGAPLALDETVAGYLAAIVPGGSHAVEFRFHDPWASVGMALSAAALLAAFLAHRVARASRATGAIPAPTA